MCLKKTFTGINLMNRSNWKFLNVSKLMFLFYFSHSLLESPALHWNSLTCQVNGQLNRVHIMESNFLDFSRLMANWRTKDEPCQIKKVQICEHYELTVWTAFSRARRTISVKKFSFILKTAKVFRQLTWKNMMFHYFGFHYVTCLSLSTCPWHVAHSKSPCQV